MGRNSRDADDRGARESIDSAGGGPVGAKVIRYTREKLLSLWGRGDGKVPECLRALEGSVVVSKVAQDPGESNG